MSRQGVSYHSLGWETLNANIQSEETESTYGRWYEDISDELAKEKRWDRKNAKCEGSTHFESRDEASCS